MRYQKFMVITDTHGDMIDPAAAAAARHFMKEFKPQHRIHLGDIWDFRWLRGKASEDDKLDPGLQADFDQGQELLSWFKPTIALAGNHDWRVWKAAQSPIPERRKLAELLWGDMDDALPPGVHLIPYDKRKGAVRFGDRLLVHGYAAGVSSVRKHAMVYGHCLIGHLHTIESVPVERLEQAEARCVGGLCRLDMGYNEAQLLTLRQIHGFYYGLKYASGQTIGWQAQASPDGRWVMPSELFN